MDFQNRHRLGLMIAIGCAVIFGMWPNAVRGVYAHGGNVTFILLVTTWVRAICMGGFCLLKRKPLFRKRGETKQAVSGGFYQAVSIGAMYAALEYLPGPLVIIIVFSHTLMLLFYMAWRGEIKLDIFTVLTTAIALGGLTLVLDLWHAQPDSNWIGIGLAFLGAVTTVSRLYVFGHQTKTRHPIVVGAEIFIVAAVFITFAAFYKMPRMPDDVTGYGYVLLACAAVTIATFGMFYGIAMLGSFRWSLFLKLEPVFTSVFAALLLGEILKPVQYAGIAVVVGSLLIYQIVERRRRIDL